MVQKNTDSRQIFDFLSIHGRASSSSHHPAPPPAVFALRFGLQPIERDQHGGSHHRLKLNAIDFRKQLYFFVGKCEFDKTFVRSIFTCGDSRQVK